MPQLNFPNLDGVLLDAPELPEGNGLTYRMSAKNCEYVVVACGRWALPNVDWTDWLQVGVGWAALTGCRSPRRWR